MPEQGHKPDFPGRDELHAFLQTLKGEPGAMFKALDGVAHGTVEKWYREKEKGGTEITSVYLLRVLLTLGAVDLFAEWLRDYASPVGETLHQDDDLPPDDLSGLLAVTDQDVAEQPDPAAAGPAPKSPSGGRAPSTSTPGASRRSPAKRGGHAGKGRAPRRRRDRP